VLTGIHLGHYGQDLAAKSNLRELLALLVARNLPVRYRLSSLEPTEITEALLALMAESPAIMPYLHIPLQSGDDRILKKMNRRYPAATFAQVVEQSVARLPGAAIGVDVLVGFPGEDEEAFGNTYSLLESLPVSYLHVFPYSKRPGTPAAIMADQVAKAAKEERVALLRDLHHKKRTAFYQSHLGSTRQILVERRKKGCLLRGYTGNYIPVSFEGDNTLVNQLVTVRLEELAGDGVLGRVV
jgi:threonylcarbamoyladenosine tRNA methylthiotransferase MtaB